MGWLWSSPSDGDASKARPAPDDADAAKKLDWTLTDEQKQRIFGKSGPLQSADKARDTQAEKELDALLSSFSSPDPNATASTPVQLPNVSAEQQPQERTDHDRIRPDGSTNISPDALYPRTMSCRQAFDQAFYCQSLGGKFNDIYRFGHIQSCSEQWGAFWFCMRTKSLPKDEKERQIREHYATREERKRKEFGSSENVWEIRDKPVMKAFWKDPDVDDDGGEMQLKE